MPRFSIKDMLWGTTVAAIGFGMLAIAQRGTNHASFNASPGHIFLIVFGGMFVGWGFSFPFRYPPHRYVMTMIGMFAAEGWFSGSSVGLFVFVGWLALFWIWQISGRKPTSRSQEPPAT